jgi:hypothetical protein
MYNNSKTCEDTMQRIITITEECVCKDGFYEKVIGEVLCEICDYKCSKCPDSTSCDTCVTTTNNSRDPPPSCACKVGFAEVIG